MQKISRVFLLVIIVTFGACSLAQKRQGDIDEFESVDFEEGVAKSVEPQVVTDPIVGPAIGAIESEEVSINKIPSVYVALGMGGYRSIGYASILSELRRQQIQIHYLTGEGLGLIVAAMFASGMTLARIEWNFYRLLEKFGDLPLYDEKWVSTLRQELKQLFGNKRLEDLDIELLVPLCKQGLVFKSDGQMVEALVSSVKQIKQIAAKNFIYDVISTVEKNVDIDMIFSALGEGTLKEHREIKWLADLSDRIGYRVQSKMMAFDLPRKEMALNEKEKLPEYQQACAAFAVEVASKIKKSIELWQGKKK